jgi:hypothetical protein
MNILAGDSRLKILLNIVRLYLPVSYVCQPLVNFSVNYSAGFKTIQMRFQPAIPE